jgi:hypothetical protein
MAAITSPLGHFRQIDAHWRKSRSLAGHQRRRHPERADYLTAAARPASGQPAAAPPSQSDEIAAFHLLLQAQEKLS